MLDSFVPSVMPIVPRYIPSMSEGIASVTVIYREAPGSSVNELSLSVITSAMPVPRYSNAGRAISVSDSGPS